MKKRLLSISMAACMLIGLIAAGTMVLADDGEYLARFGAQMSGVDGWGLGEIAETTFKIGEPATISIDFGEAVSFGDGNYIAIETNLPNPLDGAKIAIIPTVAEVLTFKLDGKEIEMGNAYVNAEGMAAIDESGPGLRLTLTNKWNEDIETQPVDPTELGEFTTLEIEFIVHGVDPIYLARFGAQMDGVDGWGLGEIAETTFKIGAPATISIDFGETVSFGDGNYIAIETNLPNPYEGATIFTDTEIAEILSFKLDGNEVTMGDVYINAEGMAAIDESGPGLRLTLTNKWNGDIETQPVDPTELGEFTTLEIEFIIYGVGDVPEEVELGDIIMEGNAWFGGTFAFSAGHPLADENPDLEPDGCEWYSVTDQSVPFKIGEPFTVTVEAGSGTITHDVATNWDGYALAIDTDNLTAPALLDVYIDSVKLDGNDLYFNEEFAGIGQGDDKGLRVSLTSAWSDAPFASPSEIGTFTKLEVTLAFVEYGAESPFGPSTSTPEPPPPSVDPITPPPASPSTGGDEGGGMPGWVVPVIIVSAVVIIGVVVLVIVKSKGGK